MFQGDDFEVHRRKRRSHVTDANGNRILRVVKRDATEMAEVETTEKIIQVYSPKKDIYLWKLLNHNHSIFN